MAAGLVGQSRRRFLSVAPHRAGDENPQARADCEYLLLRDEVRWPDGRYGLHHVQRSAGRTHLLAGARDRQLRRHRQRNRAGLYPHSDGRGTVDASATRCPAEADSGRAFLRAGRICTLRALLPLPSLRFHHRRDSRPQRRSAIRLKIMPSKDTTSITPKRDAGQSLSGMFDLDGQVAFIPGGYGGLGEAIAYGLAMHGARVVIGGRDGAKADALARKIHQASGADTSAVALDVTDVFTIPGAIDHVVDRF